MRPPGPLTRTADLVGFTELCSRVPAASVVRVLNQIFTRFDEVAASHGVAKVDVIGDAYFCIAGHTRGSDPAQATHMVQQAKGMLQARGCPWGCPGG